MGTGNTEGEWRGMGLAVVVNPWGSCESGRRGDRRGIFRASAACQSGRNKADHLGP